MIVKLAMRTLFAHPIRSAVLAAGFGSGVAVMAILLGVAEIVLLQARSPDLVGGGNVLISGADGRLTSARVLLAGPLGTPPLSERIIAASPWRREALYLVNDAGITPVRATAGIPSRERLSNDPEVSDKAAWVDAPGDAHWVAPDPADVARSIDRFHDIPDVPARAHSWAEWLYFNGRAANARFYLTFLVGPATPAGRRTAGVRLQLDRGAGLESFTATEEIEPSAVARAPELSIAGNHIRLTGLRYQISLNLVNASGTRVTGNLVIEGEPGRVLPPIEVSGAAGWRSGYVVPVMSGTLDGTLQVGGATVAFDNGAGYHDHNWGFWEGVSWQWGQAQHGDVSLIYGRIFPPRDAADPDFMPGFLGMLGPDGPIGYATNITITERNAAGSAVPAEITIAARSRSLDLTLKFTVEHVATNRLPGPIAGAMDFLQMRGRYEVSGRARGQTVAFDTPGSAETFRAR